MGADRLARLSRRTDGSAAEVVTTREKGETAEEKSARKASVKVQEQTLGHSMLVWHPCRLKDPVPCSPCEEMRRICRQMKKESSYLSLSHRGPRLIADLPMLNQGKDMYKKEAAKLPGLGEGFRLATQANFTV